MGGTDEKADKCYHTIMYWDFTFNNYPVSYLMDAGSCLTPDGWIGRKISLFPKQITLEHFSDLFIKKNFGVALKNSAVTTLVSLIISLACGLTCAYILARSRFKIKTKGLMTYWILLVRVLPPISFAIPLYILFSKTKMLTSLMPVISACVFINTPLTVWFIISFFKTFQWKLKRVPR